MLVCDDNLRKLPFFIEFNKFWHGLTFLVDIMVPTGNSGDSHYSYKNYF